MLDTYRHKVVLIGDGAVGSSFAFSLLQSTNEVYELVLVDRTKSKAVGDAADLADITPLTNPVKIYAGTYEDAADADVVVITAGIPRKPGETDPEASGNRQNLIKTLRFLSQLLNQLLKVDSLAFSLSRAIPLISLQQLRSESAVFLKNGLSGPELLLIQCGYGSS